jgi:hypothetical protein
MENMFLDDGPGDDGAGAGPSHAFRVGTWSLEGCGCTL